MNQETTTTGERIAASFRPFIIGTIKQKDVKEVEGSLAQSIDNALQRQRQEFIPFLNSMESALVNLVCNERRISFQKKLELVRKLILKIVNEDCKYYESRKKSTTNQHLIVENKNLPGT